MWAFLAINGIEIVVEASELLVGFLHRLKAASCSSVNVIVN